MPSPAQPLMVEIPLGCSLQFAEREMLAATLGATSWNKPKTAEILGCSLKTIYNLIAFYQLSR